MSELQVNGMVLEVGKVKQVTDKFKVRDLILLKQDKVGDSVFEETLKFQLSQDRVDLAKDLKKGDEITLNFNLKGRKWEKDGKVSYFNTLDVWRIDSGAVEAYDNTKNPHENNTTAEITDNDLPF